MKSLSVTSMIVQVFPFGAGFSVALRLGEPGPSSDPCSSLVIRKASGSSGAGWQATRPYPDDAVIAGHRDDLAVGWWRFPRPRAPTPMSLRAEQNVPGNWKVTISRSELSVLAVRSALACSAWSRRCPRQRSVGRRGFAHRAPPEGRVVPVVSKNRSRLSRIQRPETRKHTR